MPLPIVIGNSPAHELLQKALLLLKRMKGPSRHTEAHTYAKGMYSPSEVKKFIKRLQTDDSL